MRRLEKWMMNYFCVPGKEGFNTTVVGDSKAPRGLAAAIHEGHKVGETI